jgi:glycosyltransferase involved in cell wall biosynthesis
MSLQSPKYSAILTTYNSQESVVEALRSINSQLIPPSQIIIVDDASSDSTVEIIRKEIIKNFNTTLIVNEENRGQSWGRNLGAQMATTEYLLFFDDDDASLPNRSAIHLKHLVKGSKTSYVSSKKIYSKNYAVAHINSDLAVSIMDIETAFKLIFLGQELSPVVKIAVPSCTLAVEREAFLKIGGFDIQLKRLEDMDFFLKCIQNNYEINWSSEIGVLRYHSEGTDKSFGQDSKYEALLIDRYGPLVEKKTYLQAKNLASLRLIYFSRKFLLTIPFLARNPSAFRIISKKFLKVTRRLIHERNIRATN